LLTIEPARAWRVSHFYTKDEEIGLIVAEMKTIRDRARFAAARESGAAFKTWSSF